MSSTRRPLDEWDKPARPADQEYRIKLYKVACRAARDQREQLRLDWDSRARERP